MTIREAINRLDSLVINTYTYADKVAWLSRLEIEVAQLILDNYNGNKRLVFSGYDEDTDEDTDLIVPAPYDDIYLKFMEAQIHYYNGENHKYNAAVAMYRAVLNEFASYYHRNNMPTSKGQRFIF